jgi:hypothetical protein
MSKLSRPAPIIIFIFTTVLLTAQATGGSAAGVPWETVPTAVQQSCWAAALEGAKFVAVTAEALPKTGHTVYRFKTRMLPATSGRLCFDESGLALADCGRVLHQTEAKANYADFGAIQPDLWDAIVAAGDGRPLPVDIWLRTVEEYPAKESTSHEQRLAVRARNLARHDVVKRRLGQVAGERGLPSFRFVQGAPAGFAELMPNQIIELAKERSIASLTLATKNAHQWTAYVAASRADAALCYPYEEACTGAGVKVCIPQPELYESPNNLASSQGNPGLEATYCGTGTEDADEHGRCVAGVINSSSSPYGTAKDAYLYYADSRACDGANHGPSMAWCDDSNTAIWNWSETCSAMDNRLADYWVKQGPNYPLIVAAAGNSDISAVSCGTSCGSGTIDGTTCTGWNMLNVGAANDCGTTTRNDDNIACFTSSANLLYDRELPQLVAPGQAITADGIDCGNGTSFAAPIVSGIAAQMLEENGGLAGWSEAVRAILIATADKNVNGGRLTKLGLPTDHRDGAGEVNGEFAVDLANSNHHQYNGTATAGWSKGYAMSSLDSSTTPEADFYDLPWFEGEAQKREYRLTTDQEGQKARIVLVWDGHATCSDPEEGECESSGMDADLDLEVWDGVSTYYYSESSYNTYEFLEIPLVKDRSYRIRIKVYDWYSTSTYFGLAWYVGTFSS